MKIVKYNKFIIAIFISLFVVISVEAFQQKQVKINSQEIFQAIKNQDNKRAVQLIQEAIKSGVNLDDIKNNYGDIALIWAAHYGNKEIEKLLLDSHANPDIQNNYGNTALIWATHYGNKETAKLLLGSHANPDIQNNDGDTALIYAARNGNKEIVKLLLDANANPDIKNNKNKTALDIAQEKNFHEIVKMITNELKILRESVKKEVNEHLIPDLANLIVEYITFCPKETK